MRRPRPRPRKVGADEPEDPAHEARLQIPCAASNANEVRCAVMGARLWGDGNGGRRGGRAEPWRLARLLMLLLLLQVVWTRRLLAIQCEDGTTFNPKTKKCKICTICKGRQEYERNCTPMTDAVCTCKRAFACSDQCERCPHACPLGEEFTELGGCQPCEKGTFNNQANSKCQPWTHCPPNKIVTNGTETSDVICQVVSESPTRAPTDFTDLDNRLIPISIGLTVALILCFVTFLLLFWLCFSLRPTAMLPPDALKSPFTLAPQELENCSFRYPEEEEGQDTSDAQALKLLEKSH